MNLTFTKIVAGTCVVALVGAMTTAAFATDLQNDAVARAIENPQNSSFSRLENNRRGVLTDEQKAEFEAKRAEWEAKLALTDEQKAVIEKRRAALKEKQMLTDEQKAELETKWSEMKTKLTAQNEKWAALSEAQKEEVYALRDAAAKSETVIIDKYLELGLIDEETATKMKENIKEASDRVRSSGELPRMGRTGGRFEHNRSNANFDIG